MEADFDAVLRAPFGRIGILAGREGVGRIEILPGDGAEVPPRNPAAAAVVEEIRRYLRDPRHRPRLAAVPPGTAYRRRVWRALLEIPPGRMVTYGDLAARVGGSARAVGQACRANPLPLLVPCHRVVAVAGTGGFAGRTAGFWTEVKRWLLAHEGVRTIP